MSPQSQIRGNHGRNSGPPPPPPATVVVSSTSSMRPPPPPPPPRARTSNESKGHHEEPTSSIPDLGKFMMTILVPVSILSSINVSSYIIIIYSKH
ncbi:PREDICTED: pistil-specific extensin-like protein [Wasmannia auropunctata]|uniref:pistil-specific extensin-like protein n=1 Tax=Wasmannia auropunctata TaxID=64793 RepID=UPI0005EF5CE7|nr:PREDICTED: pistil-specific extensin-like protein [Wasmannia auropunctata]